MCHGLKMKANDKMVEKCDESWDESVTIWACMVNGVWTDFFPEIVFLPCDYDDYGCDDCVFGHVFYAVDINHD